MTKHKGLHTDRLAKDQNNPREVVFAKQWALENEHSHILEWLLGSNNKRSNVSDRDAEVAATIAQWLGSNAGMSFMREALKKCGFDIVQTGTWNEMSNTPSIFGYFDDTGSVAAHDPGMSAICPVCAKTLSTPVVTISLMSDSIRTRSYFFRAHKECWSALDEQEKTLIESSIIDSI